MSRNSKDKQQSTKRSGAYKKDARKNGKAAKQCKDQGEMTLRGTNDVSWYAYSPDILQATGSLYFPNPIGLPVEVVNNNTSAGYASKSGITVPGIMTLNWSPTYGISEQFDANSPINVAKNSLYAFVRHANSGSKNYEAADLFMYMLAMDSLYSLYYEARRIYGLTKLYSQQNRYFPRRIIEALGWNSEDVITNSAKLYGALNNVAYALGSFAVPKDMALYARHKMLTTQVFMDDPGAKAQAYVFKMSGYWKWEGFQEETGTRLLYQRMPATGRTVQSWLDTMMILINQYTADEDVGIMTGDIMKAFGADRLMILDSTPLEFMTIPVVDGEIAAQIQNSTAVGDLKGNTVIRQDKGLIQATYPCLAPTYTTKEGHNIPAEEYGGFFNLPIDNPTPSDVVVATPLFNMVGVIEPTEEGKIPEYMLLNAGSEIIHSYSIYTGLSDFDATGTNPYPVVTQGNAIILVNDELDSRQLTFLNVMSKFRWHPYVYAVNMTSIGEIWGQDGAAQSFLLGDVQNLTTITREWLQNRNRVALYTMLNSPSMGTFNPAR